MKKSVLAGIGISSSLVVFVALMALPFNEKLNIQAQESTNGRTEQNTELLTAKEKEMIQTVKSMADDIETVMKEKEPNWKLNKKFAGQTSVGLLPPEKGGSAATRCSTENGIVQTR